MVGGMAASGARASARALFLPPQGWRALPLTKGGVS